MQKKIVIKDSWVDEFDKFVDSDKYFGELYKQRTANLKTFVNSLLSTQRSEILSEIKGMIKVQTDLYDLTGSDVIKNEALEDVLNKLR